MCGFVGFSGMIENRADIIKRMADRIIHRGPDMEGYHVGDDGITLGFRRLSIIDLSDGAQPMYNEDSTVVVVFNGEIYNFMELRDKLIACGHVFRTRCDTEVIVHGWEEYGEGLIPMLRGMFAFVVWDTKTRTLAGARDYFGIKPFYYSVLPDGNLLFGSEIKSFLEHPGFRREVNPEALRPYLTFQYSATEETFFKGTFKLPAAHYFIFRDGKMETHRYWDVDFRAKTNASFEECADAIDAAVRESVAAHRISDVPVGAFLSGGVDSSYITAALMPENTFSVGFGEKKFDETSEAKALSDILGIKNFRDELTAGECMAAFADIQYHMDEPQSNPSSVPLWFLAKLAREHVTVVLSGEGADEIYAGYEWYDEAGLMRKYKKIPAPLRRAAASVASHLPYFKGHDFIIKGSGRPEDYFIGQAMVWGVKEAESILRGPYKAGPTPHEITAPIYDRVKDLSELEKKQYLDLNLWLPGDILLKADKMSMAHSLELRVPYLDRDIMAQAQTLPAAYKIDGRNTKQVLRAAANKTLPDEWANREKKGFPTPVRNWMREEPYYTQIRTALSSDTAAEYFNTDTLCAMLDEHKTGTVNHGRKIWTAYTFLTWHKAFFGE
ncbi:MAG: asparagine synthase (glutamine-hydrolyzing) [Ruminococcaceae bacterium]|nr:asparagine synthase (glutamine-hydrolyzing) [Oscillospiraceae bacterium]